MAEVGSTHSASKLNEFDTVVVGGMFVSVGASLVDVVAGHSMWGFEWVGVQLVLTLSSISNFLESSRAARRGRVLYIITGAVIRVLYSCSTGLNVFGVLDAVWRVGWCGAGGGIGGREEGGGGVGGGVYADVVSCGRCCVYGRWADWLGIRVAILDGALQRQIISTGIFLSVSLNVMITALICFRLLRAHRTLACLLPSQSLTLYTRIVVLLIEAAAPIAVFGLGYAVALLVSQANPAMARVSVGKEIANEVFATGYYLFSAPSPQMIVYRVMKGRSWVNATDVGS
ncbi:hypothetical protein FA15DRAFT_710628 [Coprinopsis marcescibilis]|uniref:Uncharacterized protein n=1 Tax=Coprinopsis marcescibilis TaxID=230819 RepID=A0A5C3KCG8_COPMA|nr:hypothetical protein FA15DRAFT_710628 [Coprinopsis marcescibilis]